MLNNKQGATMQYCKCNFNPWQLTSRSTFFWTMVGHYLTVSGLDIHLARDLISTSVKTLASTVSPMLGGLESVHFSYALIALHACEPAESERTVTQYGKWQFANWYEGKDECGVWIKLQNSRRSLLVVGCTSFDSSIKFSIILFFRETPLEQFPNQSLVMITTKFFVAGLVTGASATSLVAREDMYFFSLLRRQEPGTPTYSCHNSW